MGVCVQCRFAYEAEFGFCPQCGFPVGRLVEKRADPLLGRTLAGNYTVLEVVGTGGMGRVYRAEQRTLGRTVAVKVIQPQYVNDDMMAQRFINEARAVSRLNHPNVVGVIDFGRTEDGDRYLVMEFLRGRDLHKLVEAEGPLSFARISNLLVQVLSALAEAHEMGIIHRDLKPENIIVEARRNGEDFVKVVDFGVAKMVEGSHGAPLTNPGAVCGTPGYMAPEQALGEADVDARADVFALGCVLFRCLAGRSPFEGEHLAAVLAKTLLEPAPSLCSLRSDVPAALDALVGQMLSKEPDERPADCA
jgi:serine/threonine protein kinase